MNMKKIFVNGLSALDLIHKVDEIPIEISKYKSLETVLSVGGAAHSSIAIQRLGGNSYLSSFLGDDEIGSIIKKKLINENINLTYLIFSNNYKSPSSSIFIDKNGERLVMNNRDNLKESLSFNYDFTIFDGFLFDTRYPNETLNLLEKVKNIKKPKVLDAEMNVSLDMINLCTHVAFSYEGLINFTKADNVHSALKKVATQTKTKIFVTNGSFGSYYLKNNELINIPTINIKPENTLGAGDVWHGAFIYMITLNRDIEECMKFANIMASLKCKFFDSLKAIPYMKDIKSFLKP